MRSGTLAFLENVGKITIDLVMRGLAAVKNRLQVEHEGAWTSLMRNQKVACKILSISQNPYQKETLQKFNISQSSLQQAIESLLEKQIIWRNDDKIEFLDPFFQYWIKDQFHL